MTWLYVILGIGLGAIWFAIDTGVDRIVRAIIAASDLNLEKQQRLLDQVMMIENHAAKSVYDPLGD